MAKIVLMQRIVFIICYYYVVTWGSWRPPHGRDVKAPSPRRCRWVTERSTRSWLHLSLSGGDCTRMGLCCERKPRKEYGTSTTRSMHKTTSAAPSSWLDLTLGNREEMVLVLVSCIIVREKSANCESSRLTHVSHCKAMSRMQWTVARSNPTPSPLLLCSPDNNEQYNPQKAR